MRGRGVWLARPVRHRQEQFSHLDGLFEGPASTRTEPADPSDSGQPRPLLAVCGRRKLEPVM
jgi:hypothetical protein